MGAQVAAMEARFPEFRLHWRMGKAAWQGFLRPGETSEQYRIRLHYQLGRSPKVFVVEPELSCRNDETKIPHRFGDGSLCLYYPKNYEWNSDMKLAETIVPWTSLWLHYYELWHATGEWLGGGIHPGEKDEAPL